MHPQLAILLLRQTAQLFLAKSPQTELSQARVFRVTHVWPAFLNDILVSGDAFGPRQVMPLPSRANASVQLRHLLSPILAAMKISAGVSAALEFAAAIWEICPQTGSQLTHFNIANQTVWRTERPHA